MRNEASLSVTERVDWVQLRRKEREEKKQIHHIMEKNTYSTRHEPSDGSNGTGHDGPAGSGDVFGDESNHQVRSPLLERQTSLA